MSERRKMRVAALRARGRHALLRAAVMAGELRRAAMPGQRLVATRAGCMPGTDVTGKHRRIAAAGAGPECLFAARKASHQGPERRLRKTALPAFSPPNHQL